MKSIAFCLLVFLGIYLISGSFAPAETTSIPSNPDLVTTMPEDFPKATFAGGCFWCLESEFRNLRGVVFTRSGYTGGTADNPTYEMVTTGKTGHAEANEIYY